MQGTGEMWKVHGGGEDKACREESLLAQAEKQELSET